MPKSHYRRSRLSNGMTLVTESLPQFQSLAVGVWVPAGSRDEFNKEWGLSHFLEHMMFKGTASRSSLEIAQAVDRVGGEFNAFTAREYTCFHLLLLARDSNLAIEIMTDILRNSLFEAEEIERERKVVLQEIAMVEDNPEELAHDLFFSQALGTHPLGRTILGTPKTVSSFDRNTVLSFFRRHYSPENIIFSVAGDVSHEKIKKILERGLASEKMSRKPGVRTHATPTPRLKFGSKVYRRPLEQTHVVVGFPGVSYADPRRFEGFLLSNYLGGGMSSSLFQEIREKRGMAYNVYSSMSPFRDCGLMSLYVGMNPRDLKECIKIIGEEIHKLRREALSKRAFEVICDSMKGTILLNSDSVESRMMSIAKGEMFFKKHFSAQDMCKFVDKITPKSLQKVAAEMFDVKKAIVTILGPVSQAPPLRFL